VLLEAEPSVLAEQSAAEFEEWLVATDGPVALAAAVGELAGSAEAIWECSVLPVAQVHPVPDVADPFPAVSVALLSRTASADPSAEGALRAVRIQAVLPRAADCFEQKAEPAVATGAPERWADSRSLALAAPIWCRDFPAVPAPSVPPAVSALVYHLQAVALQGSDQDGAVQAILRLGDQRDLAAGQR
jgi:hypothetical protein